MDYDDANIPSLLSIPLLGYRHFDAAIYEATRARILSPKNPFFFESDMLRGIGSPHTPQVRCCTHPAYAPNSSGSCRPAGEGLSTITERPPDQHLARCLVTPAGQCVAAGPGGAGADVA